MTDREVMDQRMTIQFDVDHLCLTDNISDLEMTTLRIVGKVMNMYSERKKDLLTRKRGGELHGPLHQP